MSLKNKKKSVFLVLVMLIFFTSCSKGYDWNRYIEKFSATDFSKFNNISIVFRGQNSGMFYYVLGKSDGNWPVYFLTVDASNNEVILIDKSNLTKLNQPDYLTNSQMKALMKTFLEYDLYLLSCDPRGNVLFNPFQPNEPARLLRVKSYDSLHDDVKRRFRHFRDNWYIREDHDE